MKAKPKTNYREVLSEERKARSKTFRNGGSMAIRIPKEFNLESAEVMIKETAAGLLITPLNAPSTVAEWWDSWEALPDFMESGRHQPPVQERHFV